jgi:hypothetical protein
VVVPAGVAAGGEVCADIGTASARVNAKLAVIDIFHCTDIFCESLQLRGTIKL